MTAYYVDGDSGSNANSGLTTLLPKRTLANLFSTYGELTSSADVVFLAGIIAGGSSYGSTTFASFRQWPGQAQAYLWGARDPIADDGATWAQEGVTTTYKVTIATGLTIPTKGVHAKWLTNVDGSGRHYGWYAAGTATAGVLDADKTYLYTSGTGVLLFRHDAIGNPALLTAGLDRVRYVNGSAGVEGPFLGAGTVEDINAGAWRGAASLGHGIYVYQGTVRRCKVYDCETHHITNVPPGASMTSGLIEDCETWGGGTSGSCTQTVVGGTGSTTNVDGVEIRDHIYRLYSLLDSGGAVFSAAVLIGGGYSHDGGAGGSIRNLVYRRCRFIGFSLPGVAVDSLGSAVPTDYDDAQTYGVRVIDSTFEGTLLKQGIGDNVAFVRCRMDHTGAVGLSDAAYGADGCFWRPSNPGGSVGHYIHFENCVFTFNSDAPGPTDPRSPFGTTAGDGFVFKNCTCIDIANNASGATTHAWFIHQSDDAAFVLGSAGWQTRFIGSVFVYKNALANNMLNFFDSAASTAGNIYLRESWFHNIAAGKYSFSDTSRDSATEFKALDTTSTSVTDVDPQFQDIDSVASGVQGKPLTGGTIFTTRRTRLVLYSKQGVNRRPDDKHFGAWQTGPARQLPRMASRRKHRRSP